MAAIPIADPLRFQLGVFTQLFSFSAFDLGGGPELLRPSLASLYECYARTSAKNQERRNNGSDS
jgi:hypothetical protein